MFGQRLKFLRENKGMSQEYLAQVLNVTQQTINNYEHNERKPDMDMLCKISDFFEVPTDFLIRGIIGEGKEHEGIGITLEEEYAKKGLSSQTQREILDAAVAAVEEARKRYNKPRK
jgi:transcriptional regulator with XRE-family HTH domain